MGEFDFGGWGSVRAIGNKMGGFDLGWREHVREGCRQ